VRAPHGKITSFDAPGAGTGIGQGTTGDSINKKGEITGYYSDALGYHGFVRSLNGKITTFDAPGAGTGGIPQGTAGFSINSAGSITGYSQDANSVNHGFLRTP
jgi:hypothetical protein